MSVRKGFDREVQIAKLSEDSLRERLILAERAVILFGWCASHRSEGPREQRAYEAWSAWYQYVGAELAGPKANQELNAIIRMDESRMRDLTRA